MAFKNRIRLPVQLHSPQFPEERNVFRKANGESKTLSAIIRKTYELETDWMPEHWHQRLKIALSHDEVTMEGTNFVGDITQDADYNIDWLDNPLHYPTAKAAVKVQVTPFDATNSNCQTCDEATQLDLENDTITGIYGDLQEDQDYGWPLGDNDSICCYPAIFSLVSYNTDYLTSASVNATTGQLSIHTGTGLAAANNVLLATYRVTCPNGGYDEANVYGNIDGSIPGCLSPTDLEFTSIDSDSAVVTWTEAEPGSQYSWELYEGTTPVGSPVQTGTVTGDNVSLLGLDPLTQYFFQIRTQCYGSESNYVGDDFSTASSGQACGEYVIEYENPFNDPEVAIVEYMDCTGNTVTVGVPNFNTRFICALQNNPCDPVYINIGSYEGIALSCSGEGC